MATRVTSRSRAEKEARRTATKKEETQPRDRKQQKQPGSQDEANSTVFSCEKCSFSTHQRKSLHFHAVAAHGIRNSQKPRKIQDVENSLSSEDSRWIEDKIEHTERDRSVIYARAYEIADKVFEQDFQYHLKENLQCVLCAKTFSYAQSTLRHYQMHLGLRPYSCRICGQNEIDKARILLHVQRQHLERKCSGKETAMKEAANIGLSSAHLKLVADLVKHNPFEPEKIVKNIAELANLSCRAVEGYKKDHFCPLCSKSLADTYSWLRHSAKHLGQCLYNCLLCEYKAHERNRVMSHVKESHLPDLVTKFSLGDNQADDGTAEQFFIGGSSSQKAYPELSKPPAANKDLIQVLVSFKQKHTLLLNFRSKESVVDIFDSWNGPVPSDVKEQIKLMFATMKVSIREHKGLTMQGDDWSCAYRVISGVSALLNRVHICETTPNFPNIFGFLNKFIEKGTVVAEDFNDGQLYFPKEGIPQPCFRKSEIEIPKGVKASSSCGDA